MRFAFDCIFNPKLMFRLSRVPDTDLKLFL